MSNTPAWALEENTPNTTTPLIRHGGDYSDSDESVVSSEEAQVLSGAKVRAGCFLSMCFSLSVLTMLTALGVAGAQIIVMAFTPTLPFSMLGLRIYTLVICALIALVELDMPFMPIKSLDNWVVRGLVYTFVGLLTIDEEYNRDMTSRLAGLYTRISGWIIFALGCVYVAMGILCLQAVRDKRLQRYRTLKAASKQLHRASANGNEVIA